MKFPKRPSWQFSVWMMRTEAGIYIHIPFCQRKCHYCDFLSFSDASWADAYWLKLEEEIATSPHTGIAVPTVYFGGGTPSLAGKEQLSQLLHAVRSNYLLDMDAEITLEANPGTLTKEKLEGWRSLGINRLSMGVQSFDDEMLKRIGRIHSGEDAIGALRQARDAGFSNISMDLMYGLPHDSLERLREDLGVALSLGLEHISVYGLILEPGTPFFRQMEAGQLELPEEEKNWAMRRLIDKVLGEGGLRRYEISNYARPGLESRHNLIYWRNLDYLGFGLGASGKMQGIRRKNTSEPGEYLQPGAVPFEEEVLTPDMIREEEIILALRLQEGLALDGYLHRYGKDFKDEYREQIQLLIESGAMKVAEGRAVLTSRGMDIANECMARFIS